MVPATRSGIDVSFWLLERAATERVAMTLPKLRWLLYLAQAHYAIAREGAKLMPATFVVADEGPLEPTLDLVFQSGLENPWSPSMSETAEAFLDGFWKRFGLLPAVALHKLVMGDPAWKKALENGPGSEIHVEVQRTPKAAAKLTAPASRAKPSTDLPPFEEELKAKIAQHARTGSLPLGRTFRSQTPAAKTPGANPAPPQPEPSTGHLRAAPPDSQEIRFTADGRSVTRWKPKRRVDGPTL